MNGSIKTGRCQHVTNRLDLEITRILTDSICPQTSTGHWLKVIICPYPDGPPGNRHANTIKAPEITEIITHSTTLIIMQKKNRCCKLGESCGHCRGRSMEMSSKQDQVTTQAANTSCCTFRDLVGRERKGKLLR